MQICKKIKSQLHLWRNAVALSASFWLICSLLFAQDIVAGSAVKILFLPFDDKVKLTEAWDLGVDVPRWFSQTVDTLPARDSAIVCVPFDSVLAVIAKNGWKKNDYTLPRVKSFLAAFFKADYVVTGSVLKFQVSRRGVSADGSLTNASSIPLSGIGETSSLQGQGGVSVVGGLESYKAALHLDFDVFSAATAAPADRFALNTEQKEGGFSVWLPFQVDNSEMNFYYLARTPFGSSYFHRSVAGLLMKNYSAEVHRRIVSLNKPGQRPVAPRRGEIKEGRILECSGNEVYINLGSADSLFPGEILPVMRPGHAIMSEQGDTLGWTETQAGAVKVQIVKAAHFSVAFKMAPQDSCVSGWRVRLHQGAAAGAESGR